MTDRRKSKDQQDDQISYQYIPIGDSIKRPQYDRPSTNSSQALNIRLKNNKYEITPIRTTDIEKYQSTEKPPSIDRQSVSRETIDSQILEYRKLINEQQLAIKNLENILVQQRQQHEMEKKANQIYTELFNKLKSTFNLDDMNAIMEKIQEINKNTAAKTQLHDMLEHKGSQEALLKQQLQESQKKIQQLRNKLLKSSQNNIFSLLNSSININNLNINNGIYQHIARLNTEVEQIKDGMLQLLSQNKIYKQQAKTIHSDSNVKDNKRIQQLQICYNNILSDHSKIHLLINKLHQQNNYSKNEITSLRVQLKNQLNTHKNKLQEVSNNPELLMQLQNKIDKIMESLNTPEPVSTDKRVYKEYQQQDDIQGYAIQIKVLTQRLRDYEYQLESKILENKDLLQKIRALEDMRQNLSQSRNKMSRLESKLKKKSQRVCQLENTIMEHIQSNSKKQSSECQYETLERYENHMRNFKVLLKQEKKINNQLAEEVIFWKNQCSVRDRAFQLLENKFLIFQKFRDKIADSNISIQSIKDDFIRAISQFHEQIDQFRSTVTENTYNESNLYLVSH